MPNNLTIAEQLLYSTIKIISVKQRVAFGTGTGFFSAFNRTRDSFAPVLVTNKHVIKGADSISIKCHLQEPISGGPSGRYLNINLPLQNLVIPHPNENVDLCAILVGDALNQANTDGNQIFYSNIEMGIIPVEDEWQYLDAIEEVTMIGCPNGISDEANNFPLVRQGITASNPSKRYNGKNEFVVDMACFPGSSGSPIFLYNPFGYFNKRTGNFQIGEGRLKLLGILYAGPLISNTGQITLNTKPSVEMNSPMHLGFAIRSSELIELERYFITLIR
ncbi:MULTISPECIES: S1 family peptidase [Acinetobacter]|uniref:Serine protease n=1 Tax=Acinetobacter higginsii TaxID=70347 RepID=N9RJZ9_9GAMM|nr:MULTISPECIES: serine protease [Acinetobacter]ENX58299.1 hypothetical protein F902_02699 [Acinetobacter higginsii]